MVHFRRQVLDFLVQQHNSYLQKFPQKQDRPVLALNHVTEGALVEDMEDEFCAVVNRYVLTDAETRANPDHHPFLLDRILHTVRRCVGWLLCVCFLTLWVFP